MRNISWKSWVAILLAAALVIWLGLQPTMRQLRQSRPIPISQSTSDVVLISRALDAAVTTPPRREDWTERYP